MKTHTAIQLRLKEAIQSAILDTGDIKGTKDCALTNTDVVEALLEVTGFWTSIHSFDDFTPTDLAFKNAMTIQRHIERFHPLIKSGQLPINFVPRKKIN
ncbi:hypothetical protein [Roseobacter litoralis]|uniref:hypothetical protein n=1 Tax=Roseobacter litoralis TaxID=42443 RepID=UPI0024956F46|nr:hypothetical protein [Roseobacter litoralis]